MGIAAALSPSGRRVAGVTAYGAGPKQIRVWDLQGGETLLFDSPTAPAASSGAGSTSEEAGMYEGGVFSPAFVGEDTLYTAGEEGIWRWDLERGTHEQVSTAAPSMVGEGWLSHDGRTAVVYPSMRRPWPPCGTLELLRPETGAREPLPQFGCVAGTYALDPSGTVLVAGDADGVVRVGRISDPEAHLLIGHVGPISRLTISPDLRWVASSGGDNTLRIWPMPDLDRPPLHAVPHDALLAKLRLLTNLRAVRSSESAMGWTIELDPFPGWKDVPTR
jgi:WD40 repeat protein